MAKARAIVKRRKAVRNIRKITKTMQMIATAKFQKSLKRAIGTKPYTLKVRELVRELAASVGDIEHPLLRRPGPRRSDESDRVGRAYQQPRAGRRVQRHRACGRRCISSASRRPPARRSIFTSPARRGSAFSNFQKRPITQRIDAFGTCPSMSTSRRSPTHFIEEFVAGKIDSVHVAYMNFISAGQQKPRVIDASAAGGGGRGRRWDARSKASRRDDLRLLARARRNCSMSCCRRRCKTALFQAFLDATTSEHVVRMVAMKSATDNADKMVRKR